MKALILSILFVLPLSLKAAHEPISLKHTKVALVVAQAVDKMESRFGHAFLRFSSGEKFDVTSDVAVEFGADLEGKSINYLRGMGIGKNYEFDVKPSPFQEIWISNSQVQERDLDHYELDLTKEQIRDFIVSLNEYITKDKKVTYNFFTRNCSTQVANILNDVLGDESIGMSKNIPTMLPQKLKSMGLVRSEFKLLSSKSQRREIINKVYDNTIVGINHPYLQNIKSQLQDKFSDRLIAYIKLMELAKQNPNSSDKIRTFIKRMSSNELLHNRMDILRLANHEFEGMYKVTSFYSGNLPSVSSLTEQAFKENRFKTSFNTKNGKTFLRITVSPKCPTSSMACLEENYVFSHGQLQVASNESFIELKGQPVTYTGENSNFKRMIEERVQIIPEVIEKDGKKVFFPIIVQDYANQDKSNLKGMSFINESNSKNPFGMCVGFAQTQRMLMTNVFFRPNQEEKSKEYYTEVVLNALAGKQTFAAGISNIEELTEKADQKVIQDYIDYYSTNFNKFLNLSVEWMKSNKLTLTSVWEMEYLSSKGLYPALSFQPFQDVRIEHLILVYGVRDLGEQIQILAYDPNIGLVPEDYAIKYLINKRDMSIESTFYRKIQKGHVPRVR